MPYNRRRFIYSTLLSGTFALTFAGSVFAQEKVVIASYGGNTAKLWNEEIAQPFQKATGIPTEIFESPLPAAAVASAEGKPSFQLAIVAAYSVPELVKAGKIQEITPEDVPNIKDIPERFWVKSPDGKLVGVPAYQGFYGIAYNTELAKASDFTSWKSLADPKWKGQISVSRAPFVAAYDLTLFSKLAGSDERDVSSGVPMLKEVMANVIGVYTSMASLQAQLGRGEVVAAPFYSTQIVQMRRDGVTNIDISLPEEGGLLLPYLLVIPKGATNLDGAKKLMNEAITAPYQQGLAKGGVWPVNPKATLPPELEKEMGATLSDALDKNFSADWWVVGSDHANRTRMVEEILSGAN
jgi:putative spermidine/putrescine transport system substrate-binding protein